MGIPTMTSSRGVCDMTRNGIGYQRTGRVSRRAVLSAGLASAALIGLRPTRGLTWPGDDGFSADWEHAPGAWRTWLLASGSGLRPTAPGAPSEEEKRELLDYQARRTDANMHAIQR
jgi:hypothetical protein